MSIALKKFNLDGERLGDVALEGQLLEVSGNSQMIKDYIVALRENARQWSASTKGRKDVNHSGKKPHPQKGTGRARQGYLGSPQFKGGGRVFGPRPKFDQHVRINKKERRLAIAHLLAEKIRDAKVHVLQYHHLKNPKTKKVAKFLDVAELAGKRVMFLAEAAEDKDGKTTAEKYDVLLKSMNNIPGTSFLLAQNVSGYDLAVAQEIVVLEPALDELKILLIKGRKS